jgi:hypothetical protein
VEESVVKNYFQSQTEQELKKFLSSPLSLQGEISQGKYYYFHRNTSVLSYSCIYNCCITVVIQQNYLLSCAVLSDPATMV